MRIRDDAATQPPAEFASRSTTLYRIWIYTANDDVPGTKGDVVCLPQNSWSMWLQNLQDMKPSGSNGLFGDGGRCELYISAQEVGTLQRMTVAYAHKGTEPGGEVKVFARGGSSK